MACCGCLCLCPSLASTYLSCCVGGKFHNLQTTIKHRVILCNSFFGLDQPTSLPPNVTMTGPLVTHTAAELEHLDKATHKFLDECEKSNTKVMVISLGTNTIWQQWAIDAICKGVREINTKLSLKVLWAAK